MRIRKIKIIILTIIIVIVTTGCWDATDIEEKEIVTTVIVDKTETGYAFFLEIASIGQSNDDQQTEQNGTSRNGIILKSEGSTLAEARKNLDRVADKPIYIGAVQTTVFTQNLAQSGIEEYIYRIRQFPEYRKMLDLVITHEKPEDLLHASTENNELVGLSIENTLESLNRQGQSVHLTIAELLETLASPNRCYFIPTIGLLGNEISLIGFTVFHDSITEGFIPTDKSEGLIILRAENPTNHFVVPYNNTLYTIDTQIKKRTIDVNYSDGQIQFNVNLSFKASLLYTNKNVAVKDEYYGDISMELEKIIEKEINDIILKSQKDFECDFLDFYNVFRIKYPDAAKDIDWNSEYSKAKFEVNAVVDLSAHGNIDYNPPLK